MDARNIIVKGTQRARFRPAIDPLFRTAYVDISLGDEPEQPGEA